MHDVLHRLQSAERWFVGDLAIRGIGCLLLGLCAAAAWWLYRLVHQPPAHPASLAELAAGALTVVSWATGWAALGEGQGLFKRVTVPGRHGPSDPAHLRKDP